MTKKRKITSANRRARLRGAGVLSIHQEEHERLANDLPPDVVYENLKAIEIDENRKSTTKTIRQADPLWEKIIQAPAFKKSKLRQKRLFWNHVWTAMTRAAYHDGCVRYSRDNGKMSNIKRQVIQAADQTGLCKNFISKPGAPKESRLLPSKEVKQHAASDPWEIDPNRRKMLVILKDRETGEHIDFDRKLPIPKEYQEYLERVNACNAQFRITYDKLDEWEFRFAGERQLRPIHYVIFTDDFSKHGRLYTGEYGHQALRKIERQTIRFNGEPSIEFDYSGYHTRMLYHLNGIDFRDDPYLLWGKRTTREMRLMAKTLTNAAINASEARDVISSCNLKTSNYTKEKDKDGRLIRKRGDELVKARALRRARDESGLSFKDIYHLTKTHHEPIVDFFGSDIGMMLMSIDGFIALRILHYFAKRSIPCLGVHDSFIVPKHAEAELMEVMNRIYEQIFGFLPEITM